MKLRDELELQSSETRARLNELAGQPEPSDEAIAEIETLTKKLGTIETRRQAAIRADPLPEWEAASASAVKDELSELRSKVRVGNYLKAAVSGRPVSGAEAEYSAEMNADGIPLSLFDAPETRADVATTVPSTTGVNMSSVVPAVFAASIAGRLNIQMPMVGSGTYAAPRITTSGTAGTQAKGVFKKARQPPSR